MAVTPVITYRNEAIFVVDSSAAVATLRSSVFLKCPFFSTDSLEF